MATTPFIDIHTHYNSTSADVISVLNINLGNGEIYDETLATCSVGVHPWHIERKYLVQHFFQIEDLAKKENVIAIGEIGLDKMVETPLALQIKVLEQQIEMADFYQKPVIIHCVRAFSELIAAKKKMKSSIPFILHGFNKNEQILSELLQNGFYISIGTALLQTDSNAAKALKLIPTNRLFLETDVKDTPIQGVFLAAANILNIEIEDLKEMVNRNFGNLATW